MFNYTFCWTRSCSTFPASIENWCAECSSSSKNLGCAAINVFRANYDLHESSTLVICGSNVVVTLVKIAVAAQKSWTNRNYPRFHSYYKDLFYFSLSFPSRTKICLLLLDQSFSLLALRQENMIWCIILRELPLVESVVPSLMAPLLPLMWSRLVLFRV